MTLAEPPAETQALVAFIDASPTPWHAVQCAAAQLTAAGFTQLGEDGPWSLEPGASYHLIRGGALVAFRVGRQPLSQRGLRLIGAHTDSPNLRLKPCPDVARSGVRQLGVEVYGGALWYTWLDRDLGVAGRAWLATEDPSAPEMRLFRIGEAGRPLARIPSVAIHLNREVNTAGLKLNPQQHLAPLFAMESTDVDFRGLLADALGVDKDRVLAWDAALFDVTPSAIGGHDGAFVFAPRLDNLASCHAALEALIQAPAGDATQIIALHDHEEVGSLSREGADGPFVEHVLGRLLSASAAIFGGEAGDLLDVHGRTLARAWHLSADMAHASHPNFADLHEPNHKPLLNGGPVIKINVNQRYATSGEGEAFIAALAAEANLPIQRFVTRTDLACGTTIGPIAAGKLGIRTIDIGNPMLSMHAIREQCGAWDHPRMITLMKHFLLA